MEPTDLVYSKGQQETFTSPELKDYISKQINRGSGNVAQYQVEYYKRIASSFASFILTIIGASLSARKRKGGMGMYLGIGLALSLPTSCSRRSLPTFAINAGLPADACCMDAQHDLHHHRADLLPAGTELMNNV
jgi:lipopolysaccharide export system permease protein